MPYTAGFNLPTTVAGGGAVASEDGLEGSLNAELQRLYGALVSDTTVLFPTRAAAAAAVPNLHPSITLALVRNGDSIEWRRKGATGPDPLVGNEWGVDQTLPGAAAARATGVIALVNVAGTANEITAEIDPGSPEQSFTQGKIFRLVPVADATAAEVTLTVGGVTRSIRDADLTQLPVGWLRANRVYLLESYGTQFIRLIGNSISEMGEQAGKDGILAVDTFRRSSGVGAWKVPTAMVEGQRRKAIIISVYGQSNADVSSLDDPYVWTTPPMPNHVLMLDDVSAARGGLKGWQGVAVPAARSGLIPARENAPTQGVQSYATAAAARLNALMGHPFRAFAVRSSAWGGQKIVGDAVAQGLWRDSAGAYTQSWLNWTRDIADCKAGLEECGFEVEAVHICFTHQEADWQTPRATYASQFASMKAEREALLASALPGVPVRWFVDQASGSGLRSPTYLGGLWPSRLAITDAVLAASNVTMVMPRYGLRFGRAGGVREDIHHAYYDRILQGEVYGHAMREIMAGRPWDCPRAISAEISGNEVRVNFASLKPLVIDPAFCKVRPDMGFQLSAGGATIPASNVWLSGQRQVTVAFPAPPGPGQFICYAYRQQDASDVADEWPIATGAVRDAWEAPSLFLPGERLLRPALASEIQMI